MPGPKGNRTPDLAACPTSNGDCRAIRCGRSSDANTQPGYPHPGRQPAACVPRCRSPRPARARSASRGPSGGQKPAAVGRYPTMVVVDSPNTTRSSPAALSCVPCLDTRNRSRSDGLLRTLLAPGPGPRGLARPARRAERLRDGRDRHADGAGRPALGGVPVLCQNPAQSLTCYFTIGACAHPSRLPVHGPGARLAGALGAQTTPPRTWRSWFSGTGSPCCGVRSRVRGRTGLTVPCSPLWPGCCRDECGCTGSWHRALCLPGTGALCGRNGPIRTRRDARRSQPRCGRWVMQIARQNPRWGYRCIPG